MSLRLHKDKGVNPRLTTCPRCGKDSNGIILLGAMENKYTHSCGLVFYGPPDKKYYQDGCPKCGSSLGRMEPEPIGEHERLPMMCKECEDELAALRAEVVAGGVPFQCTACHCEGVVKHDAPFAKEWKEKNGNAGIQFDGSTCPKCGPKAPDA